MKNIYFLGSSVTLGFSTNGYSFVDIISEKPGYKVFKDAINGTTLSTKFNNSYLERFKNNFNLNTIFDCIVIQLSTNDANANNKIDIGDINSRNTIETFGSINVLIDFIKKNSSSKIIFFTNLYFENNVYKNMVDNLLKLSKLRNFKVIDFYNDNNLKENISDYKADIIHPNLKGYEYMSKKFLENI